jgi:hypothetical protein
MTFKPAHKVAGDAGKPHQIVNRPTPTATFDRYPYLKHSTADQTLSDYLTRKKRYEALSTLQPLAEAPKKLSFDLWFNMRWHGGTAPVSIATAREIWKAAQENA